MNTKVARGEAIQYIIVENESGRVVKSVYFRDVNLIHNNTEFGIFIGEDFARGKGYGYETTKIFSDFVHLVYIDFFCASLK